MTADTHDMHSSANADQILILKGCVDISPKTTATDGNSVVLFVDGNLFHRTHIDDQPILNAAGCRIVVATTLDGNLQI